MVFMKDLYLTKETIFVGEPTIKNQLKISRAGEIQNENQKGTNTEPFLRNYI